MFDGNRFLPLTGMPIWKMARSNTVFAVWLPEPLTVATLMLKSLMTGFTILTRWAPTTGAVWSRGGRARTVRPVPEGVKAPGAGTGTRHGGYTSVEGPALDTLPRPGLAPEGIRRHLRTPPRDLEDPRQLQMNARPRSCGPALWAALAAVVFTTGCGAKSTTRPIIKPNPSSR